MLMTHAPSDRVDATALHLIRQGLNVGRSAEPGNLVLTAPERTLDWVAAHKHLLEALAAATNRSVKLEASNRLEAFIK